MNGDSANKFISALVKSLQTLCHGYVEFNDGIEIIGHLYLNIDSGASFDYVVKEKVCKNAENSTVFVSKSFQAQAPAEGCITRKDKDDEAVSVFEESTAMSPTTGTTRLQSAITSISNVLSGTQHDVHKGRLIDHSSHHPTVQSNSKRKREHNGSYSNLQPPYKYTTLQATPSTYFNSPTPTAKQSGERNHSEHFSNSSHAEFFGGDSNQSSGMGQGEDDDLDLDVTFVKEEYESQRNSGQRGVSAGGPSRLSQDPSSNQSNILHDGGTIGYSSSNHHQAPQQFASGTAVELGNTSQTFQDTSQVDISQHSSQGPQNPRSKLEAVDSLQTFQVPGVPIKYFRCPVCGIIIRHKNNIKRHMRRHNDSSTLGNIDVKPAWTPHFVIAPVGTQLHGGRPIRSYNCPICGLLLIHKKNVRRHMRKHTGEMFFCDLCEWRGTCRWKMRKHREKKHGIAPITP